MKKLLGLLSYFRKYKRLKRKRPKGVNELRPTTLKEEMKMKVSDILSSKSNRWLNKLNEKVGVVAGKYSVENFIMRWYNNEYITLKEYNNFKRRMAYRVFQLYKLETGELPPNQLEGLTKWFNTITNQKLLPATLSKMVKFKNVGGTLYEVKNESGFYLAMIDTYGYLEAKHMLQHKEEYSSQIAEISNEWKVARDSED